MGTREDGSFAIGGYRSHVHQFGYGVDASLGVGGCAHCSIQDIAGFSASVSGKYLLGVELGAPGDSTGRLNLAKTEIGFSLGASATLAASAGETGTWVWGENEGTTCSNCIDMRNLPERSIDPESFQYYQYGNPGYFDSYEYGLDSYLNYLALSGVPIISNSALYFPGRSMSDFGITVLPLPPLPLPPSR
jgi:hypothetical protein